MAARRFRNRALKFSSSRDATAAATRQTNWTVWKLLTASAVVRDCNALRYLLRYTSQSLRTDNKLNCSDREVAPRELEIASSRCDFFFLFLFYISLNYKLHPLVMALSRYFVFARNLIRSVAVSSARCERFHTKASRAAQLFTVQLIDASSCNPC